MPVIYEEARKLLEVTPQNLAERQYESLKRAAQAKLNEMISRIQGDRFDEALEMLFDSPAGDGYGLSSQCICFDDVLGKLNDGDHNDIGCVLQRLVDLKSVIDASSRKT